MPIKEFAQGRPPLAGRLRLGERTASGLPRAVTHFIFTSNVQGLAEAFHRQYGQQPTQVDIVFGEDRIVLDEAGQVDLDRSANDTIDTIFPQHRRCWRSNSLFCQGDGEVAERREQPGQPPRRIACNDECSYWKNNQCRYEGNLLFMLYKMPTTGYFQVTGRAASIQNINGAIRHLINVHGRVARLPLKLVVEPKKTSRGAVYGVLQIISRLEPEGGLPLLTQGETP